MTRLGAHMFDMYMFTAITSFLYKDCLYVYKCWFSPPSNNSEYTYISKYGWVLGRANYMFKCQLR